MSTLEDRLQGSSSIPWIPDAADAAKFRKDGRECNSDEMVIGVVVDHFTRPNFRQDGLIDVIVLATDKGEVAIHCQATVLANQMRSAAPAFGDTIGAKYLGERKSGSGTTYKDYRVVTERRAGGQIHWAGQGDPIAEPTPDKPEYQTPAVGGNQTEEDIPF